MPINLGSIVVELLANTAAFQSGMSKASYEGKKAAKELSQAFNEMGSKIGGASSAALSSLGELGSVAGELSKSLSDAFSSIGEGSNSIASAVTALGGLAAAGIAAAAGLSLMAQKGAEVTEHLSQVSQKTGIGTRDLQIFEAAGNSVGLSLDDMVVGFRKFDQALTGNGKNAGAASGVLKQLGITARDNKEALLQAADAFKGMEDGPRKAADAVALFGKSGLNMIPFLNKGRDGVLQFEDAVDTFGPKISKQGIENTENWKIAVEKLSLSWQGMAVTISDQVLPALTKTTTGIAGLVRGASVLTGASLTAIGALAKGQNLSGALAGYFAERTAETGSDADDLALQRKNEAIALYKEHYKEVYDLEKSGGAAQLALSQAQEKITAAIQQEDFKTAARLEETLPILQKTADAEKQRLAAAKQLAETYAAIHKSFANGAPKPLQRSGPIDTSKSTEALFGVQPKNPFEGAPDLGSLQFADIGHAMDGLTKDLSLGQKAIEEFDDNWKKKQQGTVDSINADYDAQLAHFQGLLALGLISDEQAKDVYLKIQQERFDGLKKLRESTGTTTFKDAWGDTFTQLANSGKDFAGSISKDIGSAIEGLNQQLANFVATGKGLNFKQIGQSLEANLTSSLLKKGESGLFSSLGNLFGLGDGTKPDGSSAQAALWVQMTTSVGALSAAGIGALPLGNLGGIANLLGGGNSSSGILSGIGSTLGSIGSGIGGLFGSIGSFFGGFLADGGDAQPGRAYIVGEKRPELFVPRSAGTVIPNVPGGGENKIVVLQNHLHITGVSDADSFKKSQTQIFNTMSRAQQHAMSRG